MLSHICSRRLGDMMLLGGLGICTFAVFLVLNDGAVAQSANTGKKEILREQVNPKAGSQNDPWLGGDWQLGVMGQVSSNPYRGTDSVELGGLPLLAYDAERLHVGTDGIDVKAWQNEFASVSVIAALRDKPFDPGDNDELRGLEKRDMAFEVGASGSLRLWRGELTATHLMDVNDAYGGHEVDVSYYIPMNWNEVNFNLGGGLTWQSQELVEHMVGVRRNAVRSNRAFYEPDSTFIPHLDLTVTYPVTESFAVVGVSGFEYLSNEYTDSPIIEDDYVLSAGVVLVYTF